MQDRDGKLESLLNAQRKALGTRIGDGFEVVTLQQLRDATVDLAAWQMVELRVELQILPNREFAVEREGLGHVADVAPRLHVVGPRGSAEQFRPPAGRRQESG